MTNPLGISWPEFGGLVSGVGALGIAAFGVTEAIGKAFAFSFGSAAKGRFYGLPYVGLSTIRKMAGPLGPALACAYGDDYMQLLAQQYRADRGSGRAPDTLRQGVRLGLPFLDVQVAANVIGSVWEMDPRHALDLAQALQADPPANQNPPAAAGGPESDGAQDQLQSLAGRFSTALDTRVNAAFALAEERYESGAKLLAAIVAIALAYAFNKGLNTPLSDIEAVLVGLVAVPLAPVAKDLSTSLQNALTAFKSIPTRQA